MANPRAAREIPTISTRSVPSLSLSAKALDVPPLSGRVVDLAQVLPGAEPWSHTGSGPMGRHGVLVSHGFTGTPKNMRPLASSEGSGSGKISATLGPQVSRSEAMSQS